MTSPLEQLDELLDIIDKSISNSSSNSPDRTLKQSMTSQNTSNNKIDVIASAKQYVSWEPYDTFRKQVEIALEKNDSEELNKMFSKRINFGTAGKLENT